MSVSCEMLLHPELLTNEQLVSIIQERHLRIPNIEFMQRDQLLELFHDFCVPYGQRRYRDSGRGRMLNKSRNVTEDSANFIKLDLLNPNNHRSLSHYPEKIKPPPDLLSGHIKRIKISVDVDDKMMSNDREGNMKRKISVEAMNMVLGSPSPKKSRKLITWP